MLKSALAGPLTCAGNETLAKEAAIKSFGRIRGSTSQANVSTWLNGMTSTTLETIDASLGLHSNKHWPQDHRQHPNRSCPPSWPGIYCHGHSSFQHDKRSFRPIISAAELISNVRHRICARRLGEHSREPEWMVWTCSWHLELILKYIIN